MSDQQTLVIVGAGFSGTATAINLLRRPPATANRIVLIDRGADLGRGAAYARRSYPYRLNVPASRMSLTAADPADFLRYAQQRNPSIAANDYVSRELYGDYLRDALADAIACAPAHVGFEPVHGEVRAVERLADAGDFKVSLVDGRHFTSAAVVLAPGNPPPRAPLTPCEALPRDGDPWTAMDRAHGEGPLFIVGSGLTMIDLVAAALARRPDRELHVLSRHGLLPRAQYDGDSPPAADAVLADTLARSHSVRELMSATRAAARRVEAAGGHWQDAVMQVRHALPATWARLSPVERARFLRHARAHWDVYRHRMPADVAREIEPLVARGQLTVHAGRLRRATRRGSAFEVEWRPRGSDAKVALEVAEIICCTGPDYDLRRSQDPLWRALTAAGLITPDPLGLGLRTGPALEVIGSSGRPEPRLHYIGPMLRADFWEATAVGELRGHAARLAEHLAAALGR